MQPILRSYEQLQRFTADASHELRAPLAATLSNAQVRFSSCRRKRTASALREHCAIPSQ